MTAQSSAVNPVAKADSATAVQLRFTPQPEHVRTARLVAVALARRVGVEAGLLDEVRLAVGEACSRAVGLHQRHCPREPILVVLDGSAEGGAHLPGDRFVVTVADRVSGSVPAQREADGDDDLDEAEMGLAVLTGLVDDLDIASGPDGGSVRMGWPVKDF